MYRRIFKRYTEVYHMSTIHVRSQRKGVCMQAVAADGAAACVNRPCKQFFFKLRPSKEKNMTTVTAARMGRVMMQTAKERYVRLL